ncbi:MAG: response regulator transcription factor [Alphaproteobacteria bacterium]|nr:response regulator transcription factor [Alphaproteobacteria bacterium]
MADILVIEDEEAIRRGLCDLLAYHGHSPTPVPDGELGLQKALSGQYDLCIVDVMLPGVDGFTICRRTRGALPGQAILMLTARSREEDVLEGFRAGCDDYVAKPFSVAQLMARVDALLRRSEANRPRTLTNGPLEIDADNLEIRCGRRARTVTRRDIEVLQYLWQERHRIVPRNDLLQAVWGYAKPEAVETRAVDMHMVKLRRKLEDVLDREVIETIRGAGYRLVELGT